MDLQLDGKRAFVSGSTRGIGLAIATTLAEEGARVVLNGRTQAAVDHAVRRVVEAVPGADVSGVAGDLGVAAEVGALLEGLGGVDVLVNNVGLFGLRPFVEVDGVEWQRYLDVNLMSAVRLSRALLPAMLERGWGRVLLVSSDSGVDVPPEMIHYGVTKAAMVALGNGLAKLTRGTEVTVNTVLGGPTYSDGVADAVAGLAAAQGRAVDEVRDEIGAGHPTSLVQRLLEPTEVARLVAYLASPLASATNGSAVRADGGALTTLL